MPIPEPEPLSDSPPHLALLGRVGFIGAGAVATTLARALSARGAQIVAVASRNGEHAAAFAASLPGCSPFADPSGVVAAADLVLLAVPDDAILQLDATLLWRAGQTVAHLSGARSASDLAHAAARGANSAALHPLMLFPRPAPNAEAALAHLRGCTWALEAADATVATRLEALVAALGGHAVRLRGADRVPYHLAAVLVSNYVVALLGAAVAIWEGFGVEPRTASAALLPLLRATVEQLEALGPTQALTGPVARGDRATIAAHLAWLDERATAGVPPSVSATAPLDAVALRASYRALARLTIPLALARGTLSPETAQALRALLDPP